MVEQTLKYAGIHSNLRRSMREVDLGRLIEDTLSGRREELVGALRDLLDQERGCVGAMRQVVIETSGLADPVPVMFSLATDPVLRHQFDVPLVVVTLAAIDAEVQIRRYEEVRKQIIAADRVIITKSDLITRQEVARCRVAIRALNPTARIIVSVFGEAFEAHEQRAPRKSGAAVVRRVSATRRTDRQHLPKTLAGARQEFQKRVRRVPEITEPVRPG